MSSDPNNFPHYFALNSKFATLPRYLCNIDSVPVLNLDLSKLPEVKNKELPFLNKDRLKEYTDPIPGNPRNDGENTSESEDGLSELTDISTFNSGSNEDKFFL